jgi:glycosyl transferase, family 25
VEAPVADATVGQAIPVYVINLDRRPDRLAYMERQLEAMGVAWTRLSATDAEAVSDAELCAEVTLEDPVIRMGRGSQACAVSNFRIFRELVAGDRPAVVILQDDMELSPELAGFLRTPDWIPPGIGLVQFEKWSRRATSKLLGPAIGVSPVRGRTVHRLHSRIGGAGAYLITRAAAAHMLAGKERLRFPIDHLLFNLNLSPLAREVGVAMVCPALARQSWSTLRSDIQPGTKAKDKPLAARLRRAWSEINLLPEQISAVLFRGARIRPVAYAERTA